MTKQNFFSAVFLCAYLFIFSQEKTIDTVFIQDQQFRNSQKTQTIISLSEEDLQKNSTNISEVLRFQSPVYIKENGRGMVSSPSFRGTTAQQTAFVWNGININSLFLGQSDMNNIGLFTADQLRIKSGGGSVIYGSGAIGGTVHLDNSLSFNKGFTGIFFSEYGSFETFNSKLKAGFSTEKFSFNATGSFSKSENNYEIPEKDYKNLNGQYENKSFSLNSGYKINDQNTISWISEIFNASQNYPIFSISQTKTKYESNTFRSLLTWKYRSQKIENYLRTAYLEDEFGYFAKIDGPKSSGGISKTFLVKNDLNYEILRNLSFNFINEFQNQIAEGYGSGIENPKRNTFSTAGLLRFQPSEKIYLEGGAKKDFIENVESPFLFSFGANYKPISWYELKINASKNFRNPSFNDLYWKPGGNLNLRSESSYQVEFSNIFKYKTFKFSVTPFIIEVTDLIRWIPTSGGFWAPENVEKVLSKGIESSLSFTEKFGENNLKLNLGYTYTNSQNQETKQQLSYVPFHKIFGNLDYQYRFFGIYVQGMFNGLTYTSTDENYSEALKPYFVANAGIFAEYKNFKLTFKVNNIGDQVYETTAYYPMPKRNYLLNLNINLK